MRSGIPVFTDRTAVHSYCGRCVPLVNVTYFFYINSGEVFMLSCGYAAQSLNQGRPTSAARRVTITRTSVLTDRRRQSISLWIVPDAREVRRWY